MSNIKKAVSCLTALLFIIICLTVFNVVSYAYTIPPTMDTETVDSYSVGSYETVVDKTGTWIFVPGAFVEDASTSVKAALVAVTKEHRGDSSLVVPAKVTGTYNGAEKEYTVTKIVYGASPTNRGNFAASFVAGMSNLSSLTFEENPYLTEIRHVDEYSGYVYRNQFGNINTTCGLLTGTDVRTLTLPSSITHIGMCAFTNNALENLIFEPTTTCTLCEYSFYNASSLLSFKVTKNMVLNEYAFFQANLIDGLVFADDCAAMRIPAHCFQQSKVGAVTFSDGVTYVGVEAFNATPNVSVSDWGGIVELDVSAFSYSGITDIDFSTAKIEKIALSGQSNNGVFANTKKLNTVKFGATITELGMYSFAYSGIVSLDLSEAINLSETGKSAFRWCSNLQEVLLPDTLQCISEYSFENTSALKSIVIPTSIKSIEAYAFSASGLTSIEIEGNGLSIGNNVFWKCGSLVSAKIKDNSAYEIALNRGTFADCPLLQTIEIDANLVRVPDNFASGTYSLSTVILPDTVVTYGMESFSSTAAYDKGFLKSFELSANTKYIEKSTFQHRKGLESIDVPDTLETIGESAYFGCTSLKAVNISKRSALGFVGASAFRDCTALSTFYCPDSLKQLGNYAFYNTGFTEFTFGEYVTTIGDNCFETCKNLQTVEFDGELITVIPYKAFSGCTKLHTIALPKSVGVISAEAFYNCDLSNFYYGDRETYIGAKAFMNTKLTNEDFPSTLLTIEASAYNNTKLVDVEIPASVISCGTGAFYNISTLRTLKFEDGTEIKTIPTDFVSDAGTCYAIVTIPSSVTTLASRAFGSMYKCVFEDATVTSIGDSCFAALVRIVENFPAHQDTIKLLCAHNGNQAVDKFTFNPTSTVTKLVDSLMYVNESIDLPESLKMWYTTGINQGTFKGTTLELKNVEYVGQYVGTDYAVNLGGGNTGGSPIANTPNLTAEGFTGEKLTFLAGLYYTNGNINYREECPELKYFRGGYNCTDYDMRNWLPDGMTAVQNACNDAYGNVANVLYLPNAAIFNITTGTDKRYATFVMHENTVQFGTTWLGDNAGAQKWGNLYSDIVITSKNNLLTLSNIYGGVPTPPGTIYVSDENTYNALVNEQATVTGVNATHTNYLKGLKIARRMSDIEATCTSTPNGVQLNMTLSAEAPTIKGSLKVYDISDAENNVLIGSVPVSSANATVFLDDVDVNSGVNTFRVDFVSDSITTMDSTTQVTYSKTAVPTTINTTTTLMDDGKSTTLTATVVVSDTATAEQQTKLPKGTLKLYWIDENNQNVFIKSQPVTNATDNTLTCIMNADSAYVRSGINNYKLVFESVDSDTYLDSYATETVTYVGSPVNLSGTLTDFKGGLNCNIAIDATALNYGTLTLYLGDNQLGTVLNENNGTSIFISPDKIKKGTVQVLAEYKSNSARYTSETKLLEYAYNPTVTTTTLTTDYDDTGDSVVISGSIDDVENGNYSGVLKLYYVTGDGEVLVKETDSTSIIASIPKSNLNKGVNVFRLDYYPDTIETSYASTLSEIRVAGTNVALIGATTNMGEQISISVKPVVNGQAIDPSKIKIWQGASEFGRELTTEVDSSGEIAIAYVPKTDLFVGTNVFYADYVDDTDEYESDGLTLYFGMAVDGSESTGDSDKETAEKLQEIIDAVVDLSDTLDIDLNLLIKTINDNFAILDTDLQSIKDALVELTKNKPIDYTDNFNEIVDAIKGLSLNSGGTGSNDEVKTILQSIADKMDEDNTYYTQISAALSKLDELEDISTELENIKTEIANGNTVSSEVLTKLDAIASALDTAFDTDDLEAVLAEILEALKQQAENDSDIQEGLDDIGDAIDQSTTDIIAAIDKLIQSNDMSGIIDAIKQISTNGGGQADLSKIENILQELVDKTGSTNATFDTTALEALLAEIVKQGEESNLDTTGIESVLNSLKTSIENNIAKSLADIKTAIENNSIKPEDVAGIIAALEKIGSNNNADSQILKELQTISSALQQIAQNGTNGNNGSGITGDDIDKIVDAIEGSNNNDDIVDAIWQSSQQNNNQSDWKDFEAILNSITQGSGGTDTVVFDTTELERLIEKLITESNKPNSDTSVNSQVLNDIKTALTDNKEMLGTIASGLVNLANNMKGMYQNNQSSSSVVADPSLLKALNNISSMLDTANQNGVTGQQLTNIADGLDNIYKAITTTAITHEDIVRVIAAIEGIELKNETDPKLLESLNGILGTLETLKGEQKVLFDGLSSTMLVVGGLISGSILLGFVIIGFVLRKNSKAQTKALVAVLKASKGMPVEDDDAVDLEELDSDEE